MQRRICAFFAADRSRTRRSSEEIIGAHPAEAAVAQGRQWILAPARGFEHIAAVDLVLYTLPALPDTPSSYLARS